MDSNSSILYSVDYDNFAIEYLSTYHRSGIRSFFDALTQQSAYITETHKKYLTTITIGLEKNEFTPVIAYTILSEPSKIILENGTNDWKFVKGIVYKYANHKKRKSIYKLLEKAIDKHWIEPDNAGGKGQIKNRFEALAANRYKDIYQFKLATIFDSDKSNANEIKHEQKLLIEFFTGETTTWHMLHKREVENYLPLEVIKEHITITDKQHQDLQSKKPEEYDFIDFENYFKLLEVKTDFPKLFLADWTREKLEQRCEHHKVRIELPNGILEEVTEIEQILLKIAKII
jgi:hypothetical protein